MESAIETIASSGSPVLGAILVVLGFAYWKQGQELGRVQQARVDDANKVTQTMLALQDRWQATVGELSDAVQRLPGGPKR